MNLAKRAVDIWRDYINPALPSIGFSNPQKIDIRAWGTSIENYVASLIDGGATAPVATLALPATLTAAMSGQLQVVNQAGAGVVTLPATMAIGVTVPFLVAGLGVPTFAPAAGAALNNRSGHSGAAGQYAEVIVTCYANADGKSALYALAGDTA